MMEGFEIRAGAVGIDKKFLPPRAWGGLFPLLEKPFYDDPGTKSKH